MVMSDLPSPSKSLARDVSSPPSAIADVSGMSPGPPKPVTLIDVVKFDDDLSAAQAPVDDWNVPKSRRPSPSKSAGTGTKPGPPKVAANDVVNPLVDLSTDQTPLLRL